MLREKVLELLAALGVEGAATDPLLPFVIQAATSAIVDATNLSAIPNELLIAGVYNATGQYLKLKKDTGQLQGFDLSGAVKQIQEGDTSITFAIGEGDMTPEQRLEGLLAWMMTFGKDQLYRYRKLRW